MTVKATITEQQRQKLNSRKAILDAANICYARKGITATTIDDIAEQASLGRATIYRHFSNHDDILSHLLHREFNSVYETIQEKILVEDDPREILRFVFTFILTEFQKLPLHRIIMREDTAFTMARLANNSELLSNLQLSLVKPMHRKIQAAGLLREGITAPMLADWLQRLTLALYTIPSDVLSGEKNIQRYLDSFVIPSLLKDG